MKKFKSEDIMKRYEKFVNDFLSSEQGIKKVELLPQVWLIRIDRVNFVCMISCRVIHNPLGYEEWMAVVKEKGVPDRCYLLFEKEINDYLFRRSNIKGL